MSQNIDFNSDEYVKFLNHAKALGYALIPFAEVENTPQKAIILRHDIDFSLIPALEMAKAEAKEGAKATYFIMVANDYYNVLSKENRARIQAISELGHEIGLHWDSSTYPENQDEMCKQFRLEVDILSNIIGKEVFSASQHIPTDSPLFDVESLIANEAYSQKWRQRFKYVSDSSMAWREFTPLDLMAEGHEIHFTSHPLWWFTTGASRDEKLVKSVKEQTQIMARTADEFVIYMNKILANRAQFDQSFKEKKGW